MVDYYSMYTMTTTSHDTSIHPQAVHSWTAAGGVEMVTWCVWILFQLLVATRASCEATKTKTKMV